MKSSKLLNITKIFFRKLLELFLRGFPRWILIRLFTECADAYSRGREPQEGLYFLFELGSRISKLQSALSTTREGGIHPKHRLTKYHDFFVKHIEGKETVLDIGCGAGFVAHDVAEKTGVSVTGIDLNKKNINAACEKRSHPNVTYIHGDALCDLPDDHYDVIILSNVLEHIEYRVDFLKQVHERCSPNKWLIRVPLYDRDWRVPLMREIGVDWRLDDTHFIEYTIESFEYEMLQAGLEIDYIEFRWGEIWCKLF